MSDILKENKLFWEKCFADLDFDFKLPQSKMEILEFAVGSNGRREVWVRKKENNFA